MKTIVGTALMLLLWNSAAAQTKKASSGAPAPPSVMQRGKTVYATYCLPCHQEDGSGVPHLNPPVTPNPWVSGDKGRLIQLVLHGSQGQVEIDGDRWANSMPANTHLSDEQIADVLTYVRQSFGNTASAIKASEVKAVRAKKK
jgi:mono/diheme cytochrome c family protein